MKNIFDQYFHSDSKFICPQPTHWDQIYKIIGSPKSTGAPLILGAWNTSTVVQKKERFLKHLEFISNNENLVNKVSIYLENLKNEDWLIL